jgi:glycosyltransferase involved in cell wall biosynthesis
VRDVSVVIPAFNSMQHIGEALDSIKAQTLTDFEVIVVDDGSSDATMVVAESYAGALDLQVIRQRNLGPAAARNTGIGAASGRYCAFLDADDIMLPERLVEQLALLESDPQIALVHSDLMTFNERGIIHNTRRAFSDPRGGLVLDYLLMGNFITTSTVMARRDRLIEVGMFREGRRR